MIDKNNTGNFIAFINLNRTIDLVNYCILIFVDMETKTPEQKEIIDTFVKIIQFEKFKYKFDVIKETKITNCTG